MDAPFTDLRMEMTYGFDPSAGGEAIPQKAEGRQPVRN